MRFLIKLVLIAGIALFGLINLRAYSFDKGFSKTEIPEDKTIIETIKTLTNLEEIEYYETTFDSDKYVYNIYIKTSEDCYLLKATQNDIDAFNTLGIFANNLKPEKISPIPIYVELALMGLILIIPFKKRG